MMLYGVTPEQQATVVAPQLVGRVLSQERGRYRVMTVKGLVGAQTSGRFNHAVLTPRDYPAVGDVVALLTTADAQTALIQRVLPRQSVFVRQAAGTGHHEQVVAANVATVFVCMALNHDFNPRRLDRYLTVGWDSGATPVILLTKADLCADLDEKLAAVQQVAPGTPVVVTSAQTATGLADLSPYLRAGQTCALLGSSGVGKSTLINWLLGRDEIATNGLRNDDKGRHTTTTRQLYRLAGGALLIDTPGMRELGLWDAAAGLDRQFTDVTTLAQQCRFRDCHHHGEPGCAIQAALTAGTLSVERWQSYQKLLAENAYSADSAGYRARKHAAAVANAKQVRQIYHPTGRTRRR